nr:hypothetical protein [Tissierella sp.]
MKLTCNTIEDMMPLVADDLASEDTVKLVNEHMENCKKCKIEYEEMKKDYSFKDKKGSEAIPLKNIKRRLRNKNIYTGVLTALIISLILLLVIDKSTKPIPISFNKAVEYTKYENGRVFIQFTPEVTDYDVTSYGSNHDIMAWKTNIGKIFKSSQAKNTSVTIDKENNPTVYYLEQTGQLDHKIYGAMPGGSEGGRLTLPRIVLNYYVYLIGIIFLVFLSLSIIFRKKDKLKKIANIISLLTLSYLLSHLMVLRFQNSTHHLIRDFTFVLGAMFLIFSIFIAFSYKEDFMKGK